MFQGLISVKSGFALLHFYMNYLLKISNRQLASSALALLLLNAFYWFAESGHGWSDINSVIAYSNSSEYIKLAIFGYLALFFVATVKGERYWKPFFVLFAIWAELARIIFTLDQFAPERTGTQLFKGVFIKFDGSWPVQLFATIGLIPLFLLIARYLPLLISKLKSVKAHYLSKDSGWVANAIAAVIIVAGATALDLQILDVKETAEAQGVGLSEAFQWGLAVTWILGVIAVLLNTVFFFAIAVMVLASREIWFKELVAIASALKDFRINQYITRLLTGYLYAVGYVVIVASVAVSVPMLAFAQFGLQRSELGKGFHPELYAIFPAAVLMGFIVSFAIILVVRLVVEVSVAIVHIAQNTAARKF